jgi:hypothetical protein
MSVPLPGGGTATFRDRLTYAQGRSIRAALLAIDSDSMATADLDLILLRAYVSSWDVKDLAGEAVSLEHPELAPDDVIQAIAAESIKRWKSAVIPKAGNGSSATMLQVLPSESPTPISEISSSLPDTPAGVGPI